MKKLKQKKTNKNNLKDNEIIWEKKLFNKNKLKIKINRNFNKNMKNIIKDEQIN